ncbi:MAG: hypothetical protein Q9191_004396 [Dirinaria sp. TL-2023a]
MARNKKGRTANIKVNQLAREAARLGLHDTKPSPPSPKIPPEPLSPPPLPPKMLAMDMKRILLDRKRVWVEAGLVALPDEEPGSEFGPPKATSLSDYKKIKMPPGQEYDPVIRQWNMYMNSNPDTHVMLLLYPEKFPNQLYNVKTGQKPIGMRIKPNFGLVEVDIPLDPYAPSFDKVRGVIYGEALRKSKVLKERGGAYGLAGGFGVDEADEGKSKKGGTKKRGTKQSGAAASTSRSTEEAEPTVEELLADYDNAVKNGHVMNKMILGGKIIPWTPENPNFFVGHFEKCKSYIPLYRGPTLAILTVTQANVFFTKVNAICALRPQLIHLDALNDLNKSTLKMQAGADTEANEAVNVNMTIKKSEGKSTENAGDAKEIARLLRAMRAEPWQHLSWVDKDTQEAHDKFDEIFVRDKTTLAKTPKLVSNITPEQWLDVISCPRIDPLNPKKRSMRTPADVDDLSPTDSESDYDYYMETESEAEEVAGAAKGPVEAPRSGAENPSSEDEPGETPEMAKERVEALRAWEAEQAHAGALEEDEDSWEDEEHGEDEENEDDVEDFPDEEGDYWEDEDDN